MDTTHQVGCVHNVSKHFEAKIALFLPFPSGTVIKSVSLGFKDNNPEKNMEFDFYREYVRGGHIHQFASLGYTDGEFNDQQYSVTYRLAYDYGYYFVVEFPADSPDLVFCSLRIGIEKPVFKPSVNSLPSEENLEIGDNLNKDDLPENEINGSHHGFLVSPGSMFLPRHRPVRQFLFSGMNGCVKVDPRFGSDRVTITKPLFLPHGTRVRLVGANIYDGSSAENLQISLLRMNRLSRNIETVHIIEYPYNYAGGFVEFVQEIPSEPYWYGHKINSYKYAYYFQAQFPHDHDKLMFCNIYVVYVHSDQHYLAFPILRKLQ